MRRVFSDEKHGSAHLLKKSFFAFSCGWEKDRIK